MNRDSSIIIVCLVAMGAVYLYFNHGEISFAPGEKTTGSIKRSILATHRPRVVYFYANWCGASARYGPELKKAVSLYSQSIDFQPVDVDDPSYDKLKSQWGIQSVPATIIFDIHGQPALAESGCIDRATINDVLNNVYKSTLSASTNVGTNKKVNAIRKKHL